MENLSYEFYILAISRATGLHTSSVFITILSLLFPSAV